MNHIVNKEYHIITGKTNPFTVEIPLSKINEFKYVLLSGCSIPKSWYALPDGGTLYLTIDATEYQVPIPACNPNPISLGTFVKNYMHITYGVNITMRYPDPRVELDTNKFTVSYIGSEMKIRCSNLFLAHMVGLDDEKSESTQLGSWISPYPLDFQSHNKISILTDLVSGKSLKEIVANTTPYNSYIEYVCPDLSSHFRHLSNSLAKGIYKFTIVDENSLLINFGNQVVTLSLCFFNTSEIDNIHREWISAQSSIMLNSESSKDN